MGRALCYVFLLMKFFFHNKDALLLLFLLVEGLFTTSSSWCGAFFTMWGPFLLFFSLCGGENTTFMGDFMSLWFFYGLAPSPYKLFCGRMLLCNFHPMSSAITYSGHYVPNKAHCNTRVQFTITMKKVEQVHICKYFFLDIHGIDLLHIHIFFLYSQLISKIDICWSNVDDFRVFLLLQNSSDFKICSLMYVGQWYNVE